jgi:hypothetical protein
MKWLVSSFDGSESGNLKLLPGDLLMHFRTPLFSSDKPGVLDLWQMKDEGQLRITNKEAELPPGFELHPTEVCNALAYSMTTKLSSGREPGDIIYAPNIWRVCAGDRLTLIGERPWLEDRMMLGLFDFKESALVYWLRKGGQMPFMEEALAATPSDGDTKRQEWGRRAVAKVAAMGLPRVMAEEWRIG